MKRVFLKIIAVYISLNLLTSLFLPTAALALTGGPGSPEFASFEPVATTNMVNTFNGGFTYNIPVLSIPGPDGAGYSMSLSYHSGTSGEEEASWVGYGWTLNPGAINRSARGIPDDYKGDNISYYNVTRPNWTTTGKWNLGNPELFGKDIPIGLQTSLRYNNYMGFARSNSIGATLGENINLKAGISGDGLNLAASFKGNLSLSTNISAKGITFDPNVNFSEITSFKKKGSNENKEEIEKTSKFGIKEFIKKTKDSFKGDRKRLMISAAKNVGMANLKYGITSYGDAAAITASVGESHGFSFDLALPNIQINPGIIPIGAELKYSGSFNMRQNKPLRNLPAYGYNSKHLASGNNAVLDYHVEKDKSHQLTDYITGIPFSTPDNFILSGEGLGGSFRLFDDEVGEYRPVSSENDNKKFSLDFEIMAGTNVGVGVGFGPGSNKSSTEKWTDNETGGFNFASPSFKFTNDMGGFFDYKHEGDVNYDVNGLLTAEVYKDPPILGVAKGKYRIPGGSIRLGSDGKRATSHISAKKNDDDKFEGFEIVKNDGTHYSYGITETWQNGGNTNAVIFNQKEANLSVDKNFAGDVDQNTNILTQPLMYENDQEVNIHSDSHFHKTVMGEIKSTPYATSFMLSSIKTYDYVDLGSVGPDDSDLGGWTKFEYYKKYGEGKSKWYRWRTPYYGLSFNRGSISDKSDDVGSVSCGEKEISYLNKIETKTHIAFFVTNSVSSQYEAESRFNLADYGLEGAAHYLVGSGENRYDGLGALPLTESKDPMAEIHPKTAQSSGNLFSESQLNNLPKLERLEKIVIFSKTQLNKPISTTNFEYDYSLCAGLPNNYNGTLNPNLDGKEYNKSGKLTLKKIWFESEGKINAKVAPYKFDYTYKKRSDFAPLLDNSLPENKYSDLLKDFFDINDTYSHKAELPNYSPMALDSWGFHGYNSGKRNANMQNWTYQGFYNGEDYDPAAWHLKQIKLPSGGEILVQYEQNDYRYVQDREPKTLVSLLPVSTDNNQSSTEKEPFFYINPTDINLKEEDYDAYAAQLNNYFTSEDKLGATKKIYYKFLFGLRGYKAGLDLNSSEYITGYTDVKGVEVIGSAGNKKIKVTLSGSPLLNTLPDGYFLTPWQACYEFYSTQRNGMLDIDGWGITTGFMDEVDEGIANIAYPIGGESTPLEKVGDVFKNLGVAIGMVSSMSIPTALDWNKSIPKKNKTCRTYNHQFSYLKLPLFKPKKGSGARVKRILTYDPGLEKGDAAIYGKEYKYELENGESSGVAANEPMNAREDHSLVEYFPSKEKKWYQRLITGTNQSQSEGPLGESILPGPSVGYSRVIEENIHQGKTGTGYIVHEFFTAKDYPYDKIYYYEDKKGEFRKFEIGEDSPEKSVAFTNLNKNTKKDKLVIPAQVYNLTKDHVWMSQGFRFIQNQMHGQPKSVKTYGGLQYKRDAAYFVKPDYLVSSVEYEYFEPGEKIPLLYKNGSSNEITWGVPGKEMDITMESRSNQESDLDMKFEFDLSIGTIFFPPFFATVVPDEINQTERSINRHITSKVISYPTIPKSTKSITEGKFVKSENIAFDRGTGEPLLTKVTDEFNGALTDEGLHNGSVYNMSFPAYWYYPEMGHKSENTNNANLLTAQAGKISTYGENGNFITDDNNWSIPSANSILSSTISTFGNNTSPEPGNGFYDGLLASYGLSTEPARLSEIWRPKSTYVYNSPVNNTEKVYTRGLYSLESFDPLSVESDASGKWIRANTITRYSPHGIPVEEKDALGIYSTAKFGYKKTQPILIAKNARYNEVAFFDFETGEDAPYLSIPYEFAHSGTRVSEFDKNTLTSFPLLTNVYLTDNMVNKGGLKIKFWVAPNNSGKLVKGLKVVLNNHLSVEPELNARVGNWYLFEVNLTAQALQTSGISGINDLLLAELHADYSLYIDDIRCQPQESKMTCYVYDLGTYRTTAQFDDEHFGMYYTYDDEGKLISKIIETERGKKTIQESHFHLPKVTRQE